MTKTIDLLKLGVVSYSHGLKLQQHYVNELKRQVLNKKHTSDENHLGTLLLLQHNPVYTIGIRAMKAYDDQLENKLKALGAEFYRTNRGGLITFHGPGQLVAYPIINLKHAKPSIKWFVHALEQTVIEMCRSEFDLNAGTISDYTGVWIDNQYKVCAIGVHSSLYITHHGLAINCNNDLNWFSHIIPCGIENKQVTSLSKHCNEDINVDSVVSVFVKHFERVFQCKCVQVNDTEQEINQLIS